MTSVRSCDTRELTYRVVSGGCVCNQHPEWGVLTKNQRRAREKQMHPPNRWSHATQSTETEPSHRFASYSDKIRQGHQPVNANRTSLASVRGGIGDDPFWLAEPRSIRGSW